MTTPDAPPSLLLRNALFFTPDGRLEGDCLVEDGRIAALGDLEGRSAGRTIDCQGRWVLPGVIDAHVHFRTPGVTHKEDWRTGSAAAVAGGVTTVFDMPNVDPPTVDPERLEEKRRIVGEQTRCNFGFFYGATRDNTDTYPRVNGQPGVVGLKIFMGSSTGTLLVHRREDLERVFAAWEGQISVHAEDEERLRAREAEFADRDDPAVHSEIRDPKAAADAIRLAGELAITHGRRLHVLHTSTDAEMEALAEVRQKAERAADDGRRARITAEVCPHHLFMDTTAYEEWGTRACVNPPVRPPEQTERMWQALEAGEVQMVATDHAPHLPEEKDQPYREAPSGLPGVQTMLPLMLDAARRGRCRPEDVVRWLSHAPADIYGLEGRGRLEVGNWADLVVVDPEMRRRVTDEEQFSRCGWTPWRGRELQGWPVLTLVNGREAYRRDDTGSGEVVAEAGTGRIIPE